MDRRATLAALLGRRKGSEAAEAFGTGTAPAPATVNTGLDPYTGPWAYEQAAHLLRRATFGPTYARIREVVDMGLEAAIELLFTGLPLPAPPVNYFYQDDPFVPIGETWIDAPYLQDVNLRGHRHRSLRAWTIGQMLEEGISIREKMTLFWHNHFAVSTINDPKFLYRHITLLRSSAWGNFRQLVKEVTIDPAMLRFLNGNQNTAVAPNENYARELLELFTIGKGPVAGPGDYSNYTEDDVIQIARVLTGWRDLGFNTINPDVEVGSIFRPNRHDTGQKQLSHRFDNVVISNMGNQEYAHLIDLIFQKEEVARFISRKLYRWFVYYTIDDNAEVNVIEPMAQILIGNDYEIKPALQALLSSEHFYDILSIGPMIKNPFDFSISILKQFEVELPQTLFLQYRSRLEMFGLVLLMEMEYFNPPSVAGWKAFYQEPLYYRTWINATTLQYRMGFTDVMSTVGYAVGDLPVRIDVLKFIATIDLPSNPNSVIEEFSKILHPQPLTDSQKAALKEVLIPGLPDYEWTIEYSQYASDPDNSDLAQSIELKLRLLIREMLSMAEFYLS